MEEVGVKLLQLPAVVAGDVAHGRQLSGWRLLDGLLLLLVLNGLFAELHHGHNLLEPSEDGHQLALHLRNY